MTSGVRSALVVECIVLLLVIGLLNYELMHNLRGTKMRNNERNTLLLRAFAICDNPLYDLKLIG